MFYYQWGGVHPPAYHIVERCPVCGSKRVTIVRGFPDVDEQNAAARELVTGKAGRDNG